MSEIFSTEEQIRRAIKEAIPRDWFAFLDVQSTGEQIAVINRLRQLPNGSSHLLYVGSRSNCQRNPIAYESPSHHISPAVVESMVKMKWAGLMRAILSLKNQTRFSTSSGLDVDSWAWQLYGDLIVRDGDDADDDIKRKIGMLLSQTHLGKQFNFLPSPTEEGISAYLRVFGFEVITPPRTAINNMHNSYYWNRAGRFNWNRIESGAWDGNGIVLIYQDQGNAQINDWMRSLVRKAKVFGTVVQFVATTDSIF